MELVQIYQSEIKQIVFNPLLRPMIEVIQSKLFKIVKFELEMNLNDLIQFNATLWYLPPKKLAQDWLSLYCFNDM